MLLHPTETSSVEERADGKLPDDYRVEEIRIGNRV
jgi:hypothetical protein